jgi:hypothetical protein
MKLIEHIHIIWPNRYFVAYGDVIQFEDGLPMPSQEELDATYDQAFAIWEEQQIIASAPPPITRRQLKRWLHSQGLLSQVPTLIASIEDENTRTEAQIDWEDAAVFEATNPLVVSFATTLGLSI